jgi:hypothetical protein
MQGSQVVLSCHVLADTGRDLNVYIHTCQVTGERGDIPWLSQPCNVTMRKLAIHAVSHGGSGPVHENFILNLLKCYMATTISRTHTHTLLACAKPPDTDPVQQVVCNEACKLNAHT